ncbi:MAG TPA: energy-coupling factor ABC transporter permease [Azonexus sp.]
MNLPDTLLGEGWYWAAWIAWLPLFARSVRRAPWARLKTSEHLHLWLGMIVVLLLLWSLKAGVKPGLNLHLLGATVFTLCFGPQLAFVGLSMVAAAVTLDSGSGWLAYAANTVLAAGVGIGLSQMLYRGLSALLPRHFFVYIFVNGFFAAAVTVVGVGLAISAVLALAGAYEWDYLWGEYFPYFLLLGFAEAWLSGMVMTLFVIYRPGWVATFDDARYLADK